MSEEQLTEIVSETVRSSQIEQIKSRSQLVEPHDFTGKLRIVSMHAQVTKACDEVEMVIAKLPPGKIRVVGDLSLIELKINGKLTSIDIGWYAYKEHLKGMQPTITNGFNKNVKKKLFKLGTECLARTRIFNTTEGLYIGAYLKGSFGPGTALFGYIIYVKD